MVSCKIQEITKYIIQKWLSLQVKLEVHTCMCIYVYMCICVFVHVYMFIQLEEVLRCDTTLHMCLMCSSEKLELYKHLKPVVSYLGAVFTCLLVLWTTIVYLYKDNLQILLLCFIYTYMYIHIGEHKSMQCT